MHSILTKKRTPKCDIKSAGYHNLTRENIQARLLTIQDLLADDLECILVITGIDSHFNAGCTQLCNFLFFDVFEKRADDFNRTGYDLEVFEEIILCIYKQHISVYLNPVNYWLLLPYIANWPAVEIYCVSDDQYENSEHVEAFKVKSFIDMVSFSSSVYFPYYAKNDFHKEKFNKMLIEKWPIIQAYAIQDFGVGTFFSLKHSVADVSDAVHDVIDVPDTESVELLLEKIYPSFCNQFYTIFGILDHLAAKRFRSKLDDWNLPQLMEPVTSYQKHLQNTRHDYYNTPSSFVTLDTSKHRLRSLLKSSLAIQDRLEAEISHLIIQAFDNNNCLGCTRTYFLGSSSQLDASTAVELGLSDPKGFITSQSLLRFLSQSYRLIVETLLTTVTESYASSDETDAKYDSICEEMRERISKLINVRKDDVLVLSGDFEHKTISKQKHQPHLRYFIIYIFDLHFQDQNIGCLAYGDTFFINGSESRNLTATIPSCSSWGTVPLNLIETNVVHKTDASLLRAPVHIVTTVSESEIDCVFFENHLLLHHDRHGSSLIDLKAIYLYEGETSNESVFLMIETQHPEYTSQHLLVESNFILLKLESGGKAKGGFYSHVVRKWKSSGLIKVMEKNDIDFNENGFYIPRSLRQKEISSTEEGDDSFREDSSDIASIILVWGHFGSYADTFARQLMFKLPKLDSPLNLVDMQFSESSDEVKERVLGLQPGCTYIVVCPFFVSPKEICYIMHASTNIMKVSQIFVCVNSETVVFTGKCGFLPGVLDTITDGSCSALVLTTPQENIEGSDKDTDAQIKRFFGLVNSNGYVIRSPNGNIVTIASFIPPDMPYFLWKSLPKPSHQAPLPPRISSSLKLEFHQPLDRDRLMAKLEKLNENSQFVYIQGRVIFKQHSKKFTTFWHSVYSNTTGWSVLAKSSKHESCYVVFYGQKLNEEVLKNFLRVCAPPKPTKKSLMLTSDLTKAVIERIHKLHKFDPLPEGWFYNGTKFVSFDGESSQYHPSLNTFLQDFVDEQNAEISKYNSQIETTSWQDLVA